MLPDALVYEERYRWTRTAVSVLAACCGFVLYAEDKPNAQEWVSGLRPPCSNRAALEFISADASER